MHRGEVWWAEVPQDKRRPVLILTREPFIARLRALLVAPLTTAIRRIPTEVELDGEDGLPRPCAVNFDNVFTIDRTLLLSRITSLEEHRMAEVCTAYRFAAGC